jgi:hypothetical protein
MTTCGTGHQLQMRTLSQFDGREPSSYPLDLALNIVPELGT